MSRTVLQPSVEHPITIEPTPGRVVVRVHGRVVADTAAALTLRESTYAPVQYIPVGDVGFWPGAFRDTAQAGYDEARMVIEAREPWTVECSMATMRAASG